MNARAETVRAGMVPQAARTVRNRDRRLRGLPPAVALNLLLAADRVRRLEDELDLARDHRAETFSRANRDGISSGTISRLTGLAPGTVSACVMLGHRLIVRAGRRRDPRELV